jgi:hypothetical protein
MSVIDGTIIHKTWLGQSLSVPGANAGCCGAIGLPGFWIGNTGPAARCASCDGGMTTQWIGAPTYLQQRTYCEWCEDPRTIALKAQLSPKGSP